MLRIGIVGAGTRGQLYARALRAVPGVEIAGIADSSPEAAQRAQQALGVRAYPSHHELFGQPSLDAAVIATPDFAHYAPALDAIHAGLHLLIEKPLATDVQQAYELRDAARAAGVQCMVAFENRWNPAFVRAHELVRTGAIGEVLTQSVRLSNSYAVPMQMLSWSRLTSPAWFLMSHTVDLAIWLSGKRPRTVYATGFKRELAARGVDTWDAVHALLTFADGTTANLESLWILPEAMPTVVDFTYELVGSRSALVVDQPPHTHLVDAQHSRWLPTSVVEVDGRLQGFPTWMSEAFARRLLDGVPLNPTIEEGVLVTEVVQAIHDSLGDGMPHQIG